jgi:hypothetical protein
VTPVTLRWHARGENVRSNVCCFRILTETGTGGSEKMDGCDLHAVN